MRNNIIKITLTAVFLCLFIYPAKVKAEYIFLKDGKIIQGTIVSDGKDNITVRIKGKKKQIRRNNIIRIMYTELSMGKVYIQKRDGTSIIAYIVDEDRVSYTCRKELYSPEEFKLKRTDVLFVAERNPSGLAGEADTTSVKLTWFPPYDPVSNYNVYIRTGMHGKYEKTGQTSSKNISISGLKSNTEYYFIVKSVDRDGFESSPSNEIKITTKNILPFAPEDYFAGKKPDGNFHVKWEEGIDPDGKVTSYNLYKVLNFKTIQLASTSKKEHTVSGKESFDRVFIRSVDNLKDESGDSISIYFGPRPEINFAVMPFYAFPLSKLKETTDPHYGIAVRGGISNYFFTGLDLHIEASYVKFQGRKQYIFPEDSIESVMLVPVLLSIGYSFYPIRWIRISPAVYAGYCYIKNTYTNLDIINGGRTDLTSAGYDPVFGAGLSIRWDVSMFFFTVSGDYRYIAEKSGHIGYWTIGPAAGIKF
ncbi:MAG: fibronectin type III domain-containing protein [Spirochaetes bacterium]|nr:fibronectin type III domain-containing protein [Spirochaetota bacterium]